jgi:uncharacterized protein (DUF1810 family)
MDDLDRFVAAQAPVWDAVRAELAAGRKRTHWMWFVFPQLRGLGRSETARHYGIASRAEAEAYLAHPLLGARLREGVELVLATEGRSAHDIFGSPDDLKLRSCLTLFDAVSGGAGPFARALERFYGGRPDPATLELLGHPAC